MAIDIPAVKIGHGSFTLPLVGMGGGSAFLRTFTVPATEAEAVATVRTALEQGVTFFDTAPLYGAGTSERFFGSAFRGVPRQEFKVSTKVGHRLDAEGRVYDDYSRDGVWRSLEESLKRLGLDSVEVLLVHFSEKHVAQIYEEVFPALLELRRQGVVKAIGSGMTELEAVPEMVRRCPEIDCILLAARYSLLDQEPLDEALPLCQEKGVSILGAGILNNGILGQGPVADARYNYAPAPPEVVARVRQMAEICARFNVSVREAALQFPLGHPVIKNLVLGLGNPQNVIENVEALTTAIPDELWEALRSAGLLRQDAPVPVSPVLPAA